MANSNIRYVKQSQSSRFAKSLKSFLGYLEGTGKAAHTIKNYRLDLLAFEDFIEKYGRGGKLSLETLTSRDLAQYHSAMKGEGLKSNTRRRRLITVQRFLNYLVKRKKIDVSLGGKIATPHKIERIPFTVPAAQLLDAIAKLPHETLLDLRNQVLLQTLAETGCQVSEIPKLRFESYSRGGVSGAKKPHVRVADREVPVSPELIEKVELLKSKLAVTKRPGEVLFTGFNKFGSLGTPITSRGVELLVRAHAGHFEIPNLTPRIFRHSRVLEWFAQKVPQDEIQHRLGLKTAYAFRVFGPLLRAVEMTEGTGAMLAAEPGELILPASAVKETKGDPKTVS